VLCRISIEQGHYAAAVEELKKTMAAQPQSAEVPYLLGVAQEKAGKLQEALASFRRAHAMDESNLAAVKAAAEVLVAMGQVRQAQIHLESFLPKAGEDPAMYELAGRLAMMGREYDKAADYYQQARDLDPKNLRYMEALAQGQYAAGRHVAAADALVELMARQGYEPPLWAHMMLGESYLAQGKAHQAFETFFKASEKAPDQPEVWAALANSALGMNDTPRATLAARKALQLAPDHLDALLVLSYAQLRAGQGAEALKTLTRAAAAHPDNAMVRCLLGRAHDAVGNRAEAIRCYSQALQLDPGNKLARELLHAAGAAELSRADRTP
jgi:tetratricopeptide (TPR) repeat protein